MTDTRTYRVCVKLTLVLKYYRAAHTIKTIEDEVLTAFFLIQYVYLYLNLIIPTSNHETNNAERIEQLLP